MKRLLVSRSVVPFFFLAAWASTASASEADGVNPVTKVVNLLQDLKTKIEADSERNKEAFDKYECWCSKVDAVKTKSISEAKALVKDLEGKIEILNSQKAAAIQNLEQVAMEKKEAQEEYDKAFKEYNILSTALKHQIAEEHEAVESIVKAKAFLGGPIALVQTQSSAFKAALKDVVLALPARMAIDHAERLNSTSLALLEKAIEEPPSAAATPMTGMLTGIMEQLDNSFNSSLGEFMDQKKKADADFENTTAEVRATLAWLKKEKSRLETKVAEIDSDIAEKTELKEATEKQQKADEDFQEATSKACLARRTEYNDFVTTRAEELDGCDKALAHLTSDAARELTLRSVPTAPSFLQQQQLISSSERASSALQAEAERTGSRRLAKLAAQVKKALPNGGFAKVLGAMDTMLQELSDKQAADKAKKDKCKEDYQSIASAVNKQTFLVQKSQAAINVEENKIEDFEKQVAAAEDEIAENLKELDAMEKMRKSEADQFAAEKADDEASVKLLNETYAMLAKFYNQETNQTLEEEHWNKTDHVIPKGKSQENKDLMRSEAKYELSDKNEQKGAADLVLGMMEGVMDRLKADIASAEKAENEAIADYTAQKEKLEESNEDLKSTIGDLKSDIAKSQGKISDKEKDKAAAQGEVDAQNKAKSQIQEECDWIISKYNLRFEKRESEAEGIKRAKDLLQNTGLAFVQKQRSGRHSGLRGVMQPS